MPIADRIIVHFIEYDSRCMKDVIHFKKGVWGKKAVDRMGIGTSVPLRDDFCKSI